MKTKQTRSLVLLVCLLFAIFLFMGIAHRIQTDNGKVSVTRGVMETEVGDLTYKLYTPLSATAETPAVPPTAAVAAALTKV